VFTGRYESGSRIHEAGYDAFMAGVSFIRLAHMMARTHLSSLTTLTNLMDAVSVHKVIVFTT
jgi:hypothetical protein